MTLDNIIQILINVILFLIASYFIFYKSWLKSLGRETAKLSTTEELTRLTESVKQNFNEKIEEYKSKLNEELALKIEPLKAELTKNNITHQIQFSFLHQERAKVILDLYKKLIELHSAMIDWTNFIHPIIEDPVKEEQERATRANIALHDFKNFYLMNKLFFSESFCGFIDKVFEEYWDKGWDFGYRQERLKSGQLDKEFQKEYVNDMSRISKELKANLPARISEIEATFRKILNVENE